VVNYADDSCRLIRTFGEGERQVRLEFRMFAPQKSFWLLVSGRPVGQSTAGFVRVASRFGPDEKDTESIALVGKIDETTPAIMYSTSFETRAGHDAAVELSKNDRQAYQRYSNSFDTEREAQVNVLEIKVSGRVPIVLKIGAMRAPMDAVRTCLDDLLGSWGVDAKIQKSLRNAPMPVNDPANWMKTTDYPAAMLRKSMSGVVNFRLTVDAAGLPTACDVLTMESKPEFIKATCDNLMRRARFKPALAANGDPVASIYVSTVLFLAR
jgi:hypothetical protein